MGTTIPKKLCSFEYIFLRAGSMMVRRRLDRTMQAPSPRLESGNVPLKSHPRLLMTNLNAHFVVDGEFQQSTGRHSQFLLDWIQYLSTEKPCVRNSSATRFCQSHTTRRRFTSLAVTCSHALEDCSVSTISVAVKVPDSTVQSNLRFVERNSLQDCRSRHSHRYISFILGLASCKVNESRSALR
jgi:hypothetical protein